LLPASLPRIDVRERLARSRSAENPALDHIGFNTATRKTAKVQLRTADEC
jgi:hypothetical protein